MAQYDYLVVGAGLFGAVFAQQMTAQGKRCLVIDRRHHIGGNAHCAQIEGIRVHRYGPHIFHTSDSCVWKYVNQYAEFNHFVNSPISIYEGEVYNLPFNMNTFAKLWNIQTPQQAQAIIAEQTKNAMMENPITVEQQALMLVGRDIYEKLIKGYTEKQWGRPCSELPASIIKRLPLRFTYNNNYFDDIYQGVPVGGYDQMIGSMLSGIDVKLNTDYDEFVSAHPTIAQKTVYTGMIDEFFHYRFGHLQYRTVRFENEILHCENWQGNAVVNYAEKAVPYTRIIEHKHFEFGMQPVTVISREYSVEWQPGLEPFYPVRDQNNLALYKQYADLAKETPDVIFGGRLGSYQYADMDKIIRSAFDAVHCETGTHLGKRILSGCT